MSVMNLFDLFGKSIGAIEMFRSHLKAPSSILPVQVPIYLRISCMAETTAPACDAERTSGSNTISIKALPALFKSTSE